MLETSKAFSGFSVDNLEKAKTFYSETLGLDVRSNPMGMLELHVKENNGLVMYPKSDHVAATFTVLNFPVNNIEEAVDYFIAKGITFEQYTGDIQTDEKGICRNEGSKPYLAWFKDPAGNILSLIEE